MDTGGKPGRKSRRRRTGTHAHHLEHTTFHARITCMCALISVRRARLAATHSSGQIGKIINVAFPVEIWTRGIEGVVFMALKDIKLAENFQQAASRGLLGGRSCVDS